MNKLVRQIVLVVGVVNNHAGVVSVRGCLEVVVVQRGIGRVVHGEIREQARVFAFIILLMEVRVLLELVIIVHVLMLLFVRT